MPFPKTQVQHQPQTVDQRIQDLLVGQMCDVWIIRAQLGKDIQIKWYPEGSRLQHHKTMLLAHVIQNTNTITW